MPLGLWVSGSHKKFVNSKILIEWTNGLWYGYIVYYAVIYCPMLHNIVKYCPVLSNMVKYHMILVKIVGYFLIVLDAD